MVPWSRQLVYQATIKGKDCYMKETVMYTVISAELPSCASNLLTIHHVGDKITKCVIEGLSTGE